jgi:hypothetical protein
MLIRSNGKISKWFLISIGIFILGIIVGFTAKTVLKEGVSLTPTLELKTKTYSIGQEVVVGNLRWKIISIKDEGSILKMNQFEGWETFCKPQLKHIKEHPEPGLEMPPWCKDKKIEGKFIVIAGEVRNIGKSPVSVFTPNVIDSKSREHWPINSELAPFIEEKRLKYEPFQPDELQQFVLVYDIFKDATGLRLKVTEGTTDPALQNQMLLLGEVRPPADIKAALIDLGI